MHFVTPIIFCMRCKCRVQIIKCINMQMALVALLWKDCVDYEYEEHVLKLEKHGVKQVLY